MKKKKFKRVVVVLGGTSGERTVSLNSGKACIKALKRKNYYVSKFDPKYKNFNLINKLKTDVELNYQILKQLVLEIEILKSGELKDNAQLIVIEEPEITEFRSNTIVSLFLKHFVLIFIILFATSFFLFKRK